LAADMVAFIREVARDPVGMGGRVFPSSVQLSQAMTMPVRAPGRAADFGTRSGAPETGAVTRASSLLSCPPAVGSM